MRNIILTVKYGPSQPPEKIQSTRSIVEYCDRT